MATNRAVRSDLAIPPGEYLEEVIRELGMTKDDLSRRMDRPASKLSAIFKGEKAITPGTALQLEKVTGVPAHYWTGLEAEYRLTLAVQEEALQRERLKDEVGLVTVFCYKHLVKLGAVAKRTDPIDKVLELQRFFGVTSLKRVLELRRYQAAFRCGESFRGRRSPEAMAAWLRLGEKGAHQVQCAPFQKARLEASLKGLRSLTGQAPEGFLEPLRQTLTNAGVALVLCQHLPGTMAHGATFWLGRDKAVLMITIRGSWADIFWFNLFHEIGHLILHDRHSVIIEDSNEDPEARRRETEADQFAADHLIPSGDYERFVERGVFYPASIQEFANQIGVQPGIVVGRLQHEEYLKPQLSNHLRTRLAWGEAVPRPRAPRADAT